MDPYLESRWGDVHARLCTYASDVVNRQLDGPYQATVNERVVLLGVDDGKREVLPDVRVIRGPGPTGAGDVTSFTSNGNGTAAAVAEPAVQLRPFNVNLAVRPAKQRFVEIHERRRGDGEDRLLCVIEFLSPSNKRAGDGQDKYRQKQQECRDNGVSLVEVDLIRAGRRTLMAPAAELPPKSKSAYMAAVYRTWNRDLVQVWPMPLAALLPELPVPVAEGKPEPRLPLRALLDQVYDNAGYRRFIDYSQPCDPPLRGTDAKWAYTLLREAGRRQGDAIAAP